MASIASCLAVCILVTFGFMAWRLIITLPVIGFYLIFGKLLLLPDNLNLYADSLIFCESSQSSCVPSNKHASYALSVCTLIRKKYPELSDEMRICEEGIRELVQKVA